MFSPIGLKYLFGLLGLICCVWRIWADDDPTIQPTTEPTAYPTVDCDLVACDGIEFCCQLVDVNGIYVVATEKSYAALPEALDVAVLTVEYITGRMNPIFINEMETHVVYVYHGDPYLTTGVGIAPKLDEYDYPSDIYGLNVTLNDGRAFDFVYGYGGFIDVSNPASILDCNLLSSCTDDIYWTESILHHEFAHSIRNLGIFFGFEALYDVWDVTIYNEWLAGIADPSLYYCAGNSDEMFACASQIWLLGTQAWWNYPNIYSIDLMKLYVPNMYAGLTVLYGKSVYETVFELNDVSTIPYYPDWLYYDTFINEYGIYWNLDLRAHWQSIRLIGYQGPPLDP